MKLAMSDGPSCRKTVADPEQPKGMLGRGKAQLSKSEICGVCFNSFENGSANSESANVDFSFLVVNHDVYVRFIIKGELHY